MDKCSKCGKAMTADEVGLYKKLINRLNNDYLCIGCVAEYFGCEEEFLKRKIMHFRRMGCMLFTKYRPEEDEYKDEEL